MCEFTIEFLGLACSSCPFSGKVRINGVVAFSGDAGFGGEAAFHRSSSCFVFFGGDTVLGC